jgi:hypothetical protein
MGYFVVALLACAADSRTAASFVGWSSDYQAVAVEERDEAPDVPASYQLVIATLAERNATRFVFSGISTSNCEAVVAKARATLAEKHFSKVTLDSGPCAKADRRGIVRTQHHGKPHEWVPKTNPTAQYTDIFLNYRDGNIAALMKNKKLTLLPVDDEGSALEVYRGMVDAAIVLVRQGAAPVVVFRDGTELAAIRL